MDNDSLLLKEQPLGRKLSLIARDFLNLLHSKLKHIDLDRNYYALILIEKADGNITQQELASLLDTDKVSIVRIIDYLTEKGYVNREANETDRRKYSLTLTAKAKQEIPTILQSITETHNQTFDGLNDTQIVEFYQTLHVIQENLKR